MKQKLFLALIVVTLLVSIFMTIKIRSVVHEEATVAGDSLCNWLSNPDSLYKHPVGAATKLRLDSIKDEYGSNTTCSVRSSSFNESIFETSIFISALNKDRLGLRFGLKANVYKMHASIGFLGFWTPIISTQKIRVKL